MYNEENIEEVEFTHGSSRYIIGTLTKNRERIILDAKTKNMITTYSTPNIISFLNRGLWTPQTPIILSAQIFN